MDAAGLIVQVGLLIFTAIAAIAAVVQARAAATSKRDAYAARDDARSARDETLARIAAAAEKANSMRRAALPQPKMSFQITSISRDKYVVTNNGDLVARDFLIEGAGEDPNLISRMAKGPRDLAPSDSESFFALKVMGPPPIVRISWRGDDGERKHLDREIY